MPTTRLQLSKRVNPTTQNPPDPEHQEENDHANSSTNNTPQDERGSGPHNQEGSSIPFIDLNSPDVLKFLAENNERIQTMIAKRAPVNLADREAREAQQRALRELDIRERDLRHQLQEEHERRLKAEEELARRKSRDRISVSSQRRESRSPVQHEKQTHYRQHTRPDDRHDDLYVPYDQPRNQKRGQPRDQNLRFGDIAQSDLRPTSRPKHNEASEVTSPFVDDVENYLFPHRFKMPNLLHYYGDSDPAEHLHHYVQSMRIYNYPDQILCKCFGITMLGTARLWYDNLRPKAFYEFRDISAAFKSRFAQREKFIKTVVELLNIKQGASESLNQFVDRFLNESLEVGHRSDEVVIAAFTNGLRPGRLYKEFIIDPPINVEDMMKRARKFAKGEDANKRKRDNDEASSKIRKGH